MRHIHAHCILAVSLFLFCAPRSGAAYTAHNPAPAPPNAGALQGKVTDLTEAPVIGAKVTARVASAVDSSLVGAEYVALTDDKGKYRIEHMAPGIYDISISSPGFRPFALDNLSIASGELWQVDTALVIPGYEGTPIKPTAPPKRVGGSFPRDVLPPVRRGQESQEAGKVGGGTAIGAANNAVSNSGSAAPLSRNLAPVDHPQASFGAPGPFFALIVGVAHYPRLTDRDLVTPIRDAEAVDAVLRLQYGFQTRLLRDATRSDILTALSQYRASLNENASLLIYFAGHGTLDREADRAYWLPADAELNNNANWIIADEITSDIRAIPARHVLVVTDSCYSGGITRDVGRVYTPQERDNYLGKMSSSKSRTVLSSGGLEPVSDSGGRNNHSIFAGAFLEGLHRMEGNVFTAEELFASYLRIPVAGGSSQVPEYNFIRNSGTGAGDFVFVRVANAPRK
jgi:hypothetical protein